MGFWLLQAVKLFAMKEVWVLVGDVLTHLHKAIDKPAAVQALNEKVRECTGVACAPDTMKE